MFTPESFYQKIKPLFPVLSAKQKQGLESILTEWRNQVLTDKRWLAYILATVYHETGRTMQPIEENGKGAGEPYGKKFKYGNGPGKRVPYEAPDKLYYGRGLTQNTWWEIYYKLTLAAHKAGYKWNFLEQPETLLQMDPSIWATFYAMQTGLYTGKKLSDYFDHDTDDSRHARRIINDMGPGRTH